MDLFEDLDEGAKRMSVPTMMSVMAAIYSELARDPVMSEPAMHVRQALLQLDALCALARQIPMEETQNQPAPRPRRGRRGAKAASRIPENSAADQGACLTPLASLQPHSFLKQ